jgi:hypothetical protein
MVDDTLSLPERVANSPASSSRDGVGLCLSGGGYRAMLFHVGALWRLNELGWLRRLSGDDVLLLPGDAQWGPWQAILGNADTVALSNRTTFYKVSYHGSYNGTPKSLVAKLDRKITAGISVNRVTQWPNIPRACAR